jgi:geranyl-CoA carboxylase beta subunit
MGGEQAARTMQIVTERRWRAKASPDPAQSQAQFDKIVALFERRPMPSTPRACCWTTA